MGKKKKSTISKTQAVKDVLAKTPDAAPTAVSAELKAAGMEVTPGYVSTIKTNMKKNKKKTTRKKTVRQKTGARAAAANDQVSVSALVDAKSFIEKAGGVEKAKRALDVVTKLR